MPNANNGTRGECLGCVFSPESNTSNMDFCALCGRIACVCVSVRRCPPPEHENCGQRGHLFPDTPRSFVRGAVRGSQKSLTVWEDARFFVMAKVPTRVD